MKKTNKKAAPSAKSATSKTNAKHNITRPAVVQSPEDIRREVDIEMRGLMEERAKEEALARLLNSDPAHKAEPARPEQLHLPGIPPPLHQSGAGPLADWLEAHPGWWGRQFLCATMGIDDRTLRLQSQLSGGRVIFSCTLGGLSATDHSDKVEVLSCVAEMKGRIRALATRIRETLRRAGLDGRGEA